MALTALAIKHAKQGMHADGNGLYLRVQANGNKGWIFRFQLNGKRREMGIGTLDQKPAVEARAEVAELRRQVQQGIDPIEHRKAQAQAAAHEQAHAAVTFATVAEDYIDAHTPGWRNAKHAQQWRNTLATYAHPTIGALHPAEVTTDHVLAILKPIWSSKTETASRLRSRIELVLAYAKAKKMREGENPALWRGHLDALLPKPGKVRRGRHHPALPYGRMAEFMKVLRASAGMGARALELAILTAARSGEVRLATWSEIDLETGTWAIPGARMKAGKDHRVPLSPAALALLEQLPRTEGSSLLFPGERSGKPLSDMTLSAVIRRMDESGGWIDPKTGDLVTPHGFRSSFRDWAAEATDYPHEMAEIALAHAVGNKVEAAYRRGDMFERRRKMMEAWAAWCDTKAD